MQKIKWVLFHTPEELFIRTAKHFEAEVNKLSNNKEFFILFWVILFNLFFIRYLAITACNVSNLEL